MPLSQSKRVDAHSLFGDDKSELFESILVEPALFSPNLEVSLDVCGSVPVKEEPHLLD